MPSDNISDYWTIEEAMLETGYGKAWIERLYGRGSIEGRKLGRVTLYLRSSLIKHAATVRRGNPNWVKADAEGGA